MKTKNNDWYKISIAGIIDSFNTIEEIDYRYLDIIIKAIENKNNPTQDRNTLNSALRFESDLELLKNCLYLKRNSFENIYRYSLTIKTYYKPDFVDIDFNTTWDKVTVIDFKNTKVGNLKCRISTNRPFQQIVGVLAINDVKVDYDFNSKDIGFFYNDFWNDESCMLRDFINFLYF